MIDIHAAIKRSNLNKARYMLCEKMGWTKDFYRFLRHRDVDAYGTEEKKEFIRKLSRLLAFNYDVHRCPDPCIFVRLWPAEKIGSEPVKYPPEWRNN